MINKTQTLKDIGMVFDTYITIQKQAEQTGPFPPLDEYEEYISIWAESRYLKGRNLYSARAGNVKTDVEFVVRYTEKLWDELDETMRVIAKGKTYEIEGILPLDRERKFLSIKCYEIKTDM